MSLRLAEMDPAARYRLLTSAIVPRPIAWITTVDGLGRINLAPFSCFGLMGYAPPIVAIGIQAHVDGRRKDTFANIVATRELVINLVSDALGEQMVATAAERPPGFDEADAAGVALAGSESVAPPRIAAAPVSLECRLSQIVAASEAQAIVVAEVLLAHVQPSLLLDRERGAIDTAGMDLIGRLEGPGWYTRCGGRTHYPPAPAASAAG